MRAFQQGAPTLDQCVLCSLQHVLPNTVAVTHFEKPVVLRVSFGLGDLVRGSSPDISVHVVPMVMIILYSNHSCCLCLYPSVRLLLGVVVRCTFLMVPDPGAFEQTLFT